MEVEIKIPSENDLESLGVNSWPIWEKEESSFNWHYDEQETCYFLEGEVEIKTSNGEKLSINEGELAFFPKGLDCEWNIKRKVRKYYKFG